MKNITTLMFATVAAGFLSTPTFAQDATSMDMSTMTCGDLMKMDEAGMMSAASHAEMMMQMDAMSDADKTAMADKMAKETAGMTDADKAAHMSMAMDADMKAKMDAMTDDEKAAQTKMTKDMMGKMGTACKGNDAMTVTDAMKAAM